MVSYRPVPREPQDPFSRTKGEESNQRAARASGKRGNNLGRRSQGFVSPAELREGTRRREASLRQWMPPSGRSGAALPKRRRGLRGAIHILTQPDGPKDVGCFQAPSPFFPAPSRPASQPQDLSPWSPGKQSGSWRQPLVTGCLVGGFFLYPQSTCSVSPSLSQGGGQGGSRARGCVAPAF